MKERLVVVIAGPTGVGKTAMAVKLAKHFRCPVLSADSRQFYRELSIGSAAPSVEEQDGVEHHFIGHLSLQQECDAMTWAAEARKLTEDIFRKKDTVIVAGGSGLYIKAYLKGMDELPERNDNVREELQEKLKTEGIVWLQNKLRELDAEYYGEVDLQNPQRLLRALEVCITSGQPYSSFRKRAGTALPWKHIVIGLDLPRAELYARINQRTDIMLDQGWEEEARAAYPYRTLNALNTVGYKELFQYFDGELTREKAIELIRQHTRNYAKRQLTWWRKEGAVWFTPSDMKGIIQKIEEFRISPSEAF